MSSVDILKLRQKINQLGEMVDHEEPEDEATFEGMVHDIFRSIAETLEKMESRISTMPSYASHEEEGEGDDEE